MHPHLRSVGRDDAERRRRQPARHQRGGRAHQQRRLRTPQSCSSGGLTSYKATRLPDSLVSLLIAVDNSVRRFQLLRHRRKLSCARAWVLILLGDTPRRRCGSRRRSGPPSCRPRRPCPGRARGAQGAAPAGRGRASVTAHGVLRGVVRKQMILLPAKLSYPLLASQDPMKTGIVGCHRGFWRGKHCTAWHRRSVAAPHVTLWVYLHP